MMRRDVFCVGVVCIVSAMMPVRTLLAGGLAEEYIDAQLRVVCGLKGRINSIAAIADEAADRIVAGGNIFLAGEPGMVAELLGRAGGLCGAKAIGDKNPLAQLQANDVVLFCDYGLPGRAESHRWKELVASGALLIAFASHGNAIVQEPTPANVRAVPVDIPCESRLVELPSGEQFVPLAPPAMATAAWTFTAELIGACRRRDRQLAVYLSIFLDEGHRRLQRTRGLMFEPDLHPAPVARETLGREFLNMVEESLTAIRKEEIEPIHRAAVWLREASGTKRQVIRNFMGHLPPTEIGQPGDVGFFTGVTQGMGDGATAWIGEHLHEGDVYLFLGYQENEDGMAMAAAKRGARTIFLTSKRPGKEAAVEPLHLDVNPHWPVTDGCVELPGYDVKACPLSCIAGLTCYYAICAEVVEP